MAAPNISAALTAAQKTTMKANVNANKAIISPFGVNLTPDKRRKLVKTGPDSVSYVQLALKVAQENPEIIPPDFAIAEMAKDVLLFGDLEELETHHSAYSETLNDTKLAVGSEAMVQANRVYALVKEAASRGNTAMSALAEQLGRRYKRTGTAPEPTQFSIAAGGSVTVDRIAEGALFNNTGTTDLSFSKPGFPAVQVLVPAGTSLAVGANFIPTIIVHNESATAAGSFSIVQQ